MDRADHAGDPGCSECPSDDVEYRNASDLNDELPSEPLCRDCILKRADS